MTEERALEPEIVESEAEAAPESTDEDEIVDSPHSNRSWEGDGDEQLDAEEAIIEEAVSAQAGSDEKADEVDGLDVDVEDDVVGGCGCGAR